MNQRFSIMALALAIGVTLMGGANAQRQMENLNRGLVAVRKSSTQVYLSWRLFGNDPAGVSFNLYRSANGGAATKLNASPLTATTDYTDTPASLSTTAYSYFVRPVVNGVEQANSETAALPANPDQKQFFTLPLRTDTGPNGPYDVKFCWVGDLDGDGDYDFVVDRLSTLGENEQFLEAYTNDGTFLWRMAMGPNSVEQYAYEPGSSAISIGDTDNVTVYDMDGDGRAEVLVRTANGVSVTNAAGTRVATITDASNSNQFLSVIHGETGAELGRAALPNAWAVHGTLTNKAMIAYLDGKRPSVVMYGYNRADTNEFYRQFTAFDYRNGVVTQRWTLPQDHAVMPGSEGHQVRIADVDNDGKDEICDIGHVIDDNGTQLYHTALTHGDRFHVADINPDRPGLETFAIQQYNPTMLASALFDSGTGGMLKKWYAGGMVDVGRGIAVDIASAHKGYEIYCTQPGIYNAKGQQIYANNLWAPEGLWWDGDLGREFIDGAGSGAISPVINKFNAATGNADRVWTLYNDWGNYSLRQAYGGRPAFWGDILGDWREELVLIQSDYSALRIYTTTHAAGNRLYTLMHNPQYRCQTTTKGYVQASYVDYYLGFGMPSLAPPPPMAPATLTWSGGLAWDVGSSASWKNAAGTDSTYTQGNSVLFDISGSNASPVVLTGVLTPGAVSFFNPRDFTLDGSAGSLAGTMALSKSGSGKTTLTGTHSYTGATSVWDGALIVNGQLSASPVTVRGGIWGGALAMGETGGRLAGTGTVSKPVNLEYRGAITPGAGMGSAGTLVLGSDLTAADGAVFALDLSNDPSGLVKSNDRISVAGNLSLSGTVHLGIKALNGSLAPGTYTLLTYGGTLAGSVSNLAITVPEGTPYSVALGSGALSLTVPVTRSPASLVWTGGNGGNVWNLGTTVNWSRSGTPDTFVSGDTVIFDATGSTNPTVNLTAALPVAGINVAADSDYNFTGTGWIAGTGGLVKSGTGTLTISTTNTYSGPTTVNGGILAVDNLGDGGAPSSIGAAGTSASNLVLNGGTLALVGSQTNTNRSMTLGAAGGTLSVPAATSLQISGQITGAGALTKAGPGNLILAGSNNYSGGTTISAGNLLLASDAANVSGLGSGLVTLSGGTLSMTDNDDLSSAATSTWSIHVPAGSSGRLNADSRCTLGGSLTGAGDFTFHTPFVRTELNGNWSAFTGRIFVISDADGGDFRIRNPAGYPLAVLDLGNEVNAFYNQTMGSNLTFPVGTLSGTSTAVLRGGLSSGKTLTWQVGARNEDSTFAGAIADNTGASALTKVGAGTLTLTGASSHTGATTVSGGRLRIHGSTSATNFTVQSGATLGGSGAITGNVAIQSGGGLEHGAVGATPLAITGNLTFAGNAVVRPVAGALPGVGTYTVLTYSGVLTGTPALTWEAPPGSALAATFDTATPGIITMILAPAPRTPGPITWTGAADFNWNTVSSNWIAGSESTSYQTGDTPRFTDSGNAASAVNIPANVEPAAVMVDAAKNYTFSGAGIITGTGTLIKSGTGTLTLSGAHTYSGGTHLLGGTIHTSTEASTAAIGAGPLVFNGGTLQQYDSSSTYSVANYAIQVPAGQSGTLRCDSRMDLAGSLAGSGVFNVHVPWVRFKITGDWSQFEGDINVATDSDGGLFRFANTAGVPNASLNLSSSVTALSYLNQTHTVPLGRLSGPAGSILSGIVPDNNTPGANTVVTWKIGGKGVDAVFSGVIQNGAGSSRTAIEKVGTETLTLAGANAYTGPTTVTNGKLVVTGSLAASATTIAATGALGGTGTIAGAVTCNGTLAPGASVGTLSLTSGLTLSPTSTLDYELGATSDLTAVTGNLTLDGTVNVATAVPGTHTLMTYTGTLTNNTLNIGTLPNGFTATVNTATAGQVKLIVSATNTAPQITGGPTAPLSNITTAATQLTVAATDDAGEGNLTYTWASIGPAPVTFSPNGNNSSKNTIATFLSPGSYTLTVTVSDVPGLAATGTTNVTVTATPATLSVSPPNAALAVGGTQAFSASVLDQFGSPVGNPPIIWSATGGGTVNSAGLYTATAAGGPWQLTATSGSLVSNAAVTVTKAAAAVTLGDLTATYDGKPKPVSANTTPAGLNVQLTYGGSSTPPVAPGTYPVYAVIDDPDHAGAASGSLVIAPRTFGSWETENFTPAQILAGESAMTADPDHDGLTNLAEYALGGNPYAFTPQPEVTTDATSISMIFQRPAHIGDVTYQAQAGSDFQSWQDLTLEVLNPGSDPETVRATRTFTEPRPANQFLRLRFVK